MAKSHFIVSLFVVGVALTGCGLSVNPNSHSNLTPAQKSQTIIDASLVAKFEAAPVASQMQGCKSLSWTNEVSSPAGILSGFTCAGVSGWGGSGTGSDPYALNFDSSGSVTTSISVSPTTLPNTTWEVWVNPTRINYGANQAVLADEGTGNSRAFRIEGSTNSITVATGSGYWWPTTFNVNQWQHWVVVFTATDLQFYKNGQAFDYGSKPSFGNSTHTFTIGADPVYGDPFQGAMAQVSVYNRALSAVEISKLCSNKQALFSGVNCQ